VPGFRGAHARFKYGDLVCVFAATHLGDCFDDELTQWIGKGIVDAPAVSFNGRPEGQSPWAIAGRLAIVPLDLPPMIDMSRTNRLRQPSIVIKGGLAVRANDQQPSKVGSQTEWIDMDVGEVTQMNRIGKD
jgi:hypothetical protein